MIVLIITTGQYSSQLDFAKFRNAGANWEVDVKLGRLSARIRTYYWIDLCCPLIMIFMILEKRLSIVMSC